jgi:hypothetical protein
MILLKEFLSALKEIKKDYPPYLILFFQIIFFSSLVRQLTTDSALIANIIFTSSLCLKTERITKRENNIIGGILGTFVLINIIPAFMFGFAPKLFLGYTGRIFLGILIAVYFKRNFFHVFEKLIFVLAFISLPLFIIQILNIHFFDLFKSFSNLVLSDARLLFSKGELSGHRYLLVFLVNCWGESRNSGFMWEPAAFGSMLAWAMVINFFIYRFSLNPRLIVVFLAAVTTFSIGTYIYFSILSLIFLSRNLGNKRAFLFLFLILILVTVFYQFDFTKSNLDMIERKTYTEQNMIELIRTGRSAEKVSRVGGFVGNIQQIIKTPFGYGSIYKFEDFLYVTPNGLMILLRNWGIFSLIIILFCSYQMIKTLGSIFGMRVNLFHTALLMILIVLPISGNPYFNQPFLFTILFCGLIIRQNFYLSFNPSKKSQERRGNRLNV